MWERRRTASRALTGLPKRLAVKAVLFVVSLFVVLVAEFLFFQVDLSCPSSLAPLTYNQCWMSDYAPPPPRGSSSVLVSEIDLHIEAAYGYGQPVWVRFLDYLRLMLTGNFGYNIGNVVSGEVGSTISQRLPFTALLAFSVGALVITAVIVLGLAAPEGREKRLSPLPAVAFVLAGVGLPVAFLWSIWSAIHPGGFTLFASLLGHLVPTSPTFYVPVATATFMKSGLAYYGALLGSMRAPFAEAVAIVFLTVLLVRFMFRGPMRFMTTFVMVLACSILWCMVLENVFAWPGLGQALYFSWVIVDLPLEQAIVFEMLVVPLAIVFVAWCIEDIILTLRAPPVPVDQGTGVDSLNGSSVGLLPRPS